MYEKTDVEAIIGFQSLIPDTDNLLPGSVHTSYKKDTDLITVPAYECFSDNVEMANQVFLPFPQLRGCTEESALVPDKHLNCSIHVNDGLEDQVQHQIAAGTKSSLPKVAFHELNSQERGSAISRYKEKRKTRSIEALFLWNVTNMISTSNMNQERFELKAGQELRAVLQRWSTLVNNCETRITIAWVIFVTRKCFPFVLYFL